MATVWIPSLMRDLTAGHAEVAVEGRTLGAVIDALEQTYPGVKERLLPSNWHDIQKSHTCVLEPLLPSTIRLLMAFHLKRVSLYQSRSMANFESASALRLLLNQLSPTKSYTMPSRLLQVTLASIR